LYWILVAMKIVIIKKKIYISCVMSINIAQFCSQWTDFHEIWYWGGGGVVKSVKTTDHSITSLQEHKDSQENSDLFNTEKK
jgi:hypothetical protein